MRRYLVDIRVPVQVLGTRMDQEDALTEGARGRDLEDALRRLLARSPPGTRVVKAAEVG